MKDANCVALLRWAAPRLGLRWAGFVNVRGQVCKRIRRRITELGLNGVAAYRMYLVAKPEEWQELARACVVTISRFYRDAEVWRALGAEVLPRCAEAALEAGETELACWSAGCASGEEPYTLALLWDLELAAHYPGLRLRVLGTDLDASVLERARAARYAADTLRELPSGWLARAFEPRGQAFLLREPFRRALEWQQADLRQELPSEPFRLIFCRNLACTYFEAALARKLLTRCAERLVAGGALVIGRSERLPEGTPLSPWRSELGIYRRGTAAPRPELPPDVLQREPGPPSTNVEEPRREASA